MRHTRADRKDSAPREHRSSGAWHSGGAASQQQRPGIKTAKAQSAGLSQLSAGTGKASMRTALGGGARCKLEEVDCAAPPIEAHSKHEQNRASSSCTSTKICTTPAAESGTGLCELDTSGTPCTPEIDAAKHSNPADPKLESPVRTSMDNLLSRGSQAVLMPDGVYHKIDKAKCMVRALPEETDSSLVLLRQQAAELLDEHCKDLEALKAKDEADRKRAEMKCVSE